MGSLETSEDSEEESVQWIPRFLWKGYNPTVYYKSVERGKYCKNCNDGHWPKEIHQVIAGSERVTTFPATINQTICNALIDTGASRSCISETFYQQMILPPVQELLRTHVRSATGDQQLELQSVLLNWVRRNLLM